MASFILSCAFTVVLLGAIHAQSEETVSSDECYQTLVTRARLETSCRKSHMNFSDTSIDEEFETYILQYSGDNATINSLADKYCPTFRIILACDVIYKEVGQECQTLLDKEQDQQNYESIKGLLNYVCVDSGAAIVQLLQNDGFQTVYKNEEFRQCQNLIYTKPDVMIVDKYQPNIVTCESVNEAFECYINYVRNHAKSNLVAIANDVRFIFRKARNCAPENEL